MKQSDETVKSIHAFNMALLRLVQTMAREDVDGAAKSLGVFANGGYGTHVIAPHVRHLVDPGSLDPAVAATYACSCGETASTWRSRCTG